MFQHFFSSTRRHFRYFDWTSCILMLALLGIGLLFIFSATTLPHRAFSIYFKKQLVGICMGFGLYLAASLCDIRSIIQWGYYAFFITLILLVYTLSSGWIGMGAQRWISLYFFRFQPSELVKLTLPFFLAITLSNRIDQHHWLQFSLKPFISSLLTLCLLFSLILRQPDLGTALLILFSGLTVLWFAGLPRWFIITCLLIGIAATPIVWKGLKPYQQKRVMTLLGYGSAHNERYQIEQAKIAIGSGGLYGTGFLQGTQNKLGFLPEDHTDFIFAVVCEEWGFAGAVGIMLLFFLLFIRLCTLVNSTPHLFEKLLTLGLLTPLMYSFLINIGMVVGLLPIVGIPLPLFTYGLTHTWVSMMMLGVLNNLSMRSNFS